MVPDWAPFCNTFQKELYDRDFLKQSIHLRFEVSRGVNGSEVIVVPQLLHGQLPSTRGRSPVGAGREPPPFFE